MSAINLQDLTPRRMLLASVAVAVLTIALKTAAWYITGSVGLLSDAMESFVNLASALFGLAMVTIAQRPADDDHPYGHHKAEYFSSGFEGALIIGAAVAIIWAATHRILNPQPLEKMGWGLALAVGSSALNGLLAWVMFRVGQSAPIHRAGGRRQAPGDRRMDLGGCGGGHRRRDRHRLAVAGRGGGHRRGPQHPVGRLPAGVALVARPDGRGRGARGDGGNPEGTGRLCPSTIRFDHLSTRRAGQRRFVDLHMHMPANWSLGRAAAVRASVEQALMSAVPGLRATIQLLPSDVEAHSGDEADLI